MKNIFRKTLAMIMVLAVVLSYMPLNNLAYADSNEISTAEDFAAMQANGSYVLTADISLSASYSNEFTGTFDGNGHTITMNESGGIFRTIGAGANVSNLKVAGEISGTGNIGGIANAANGGTITKCINTATITSTSIKGRAAGIVGTSSGSDNNLVISECANFGAINATGASGYAAGIDAYTAGNVNITKCYNTGALSSKYRSAGMVCQNGSSIPVTYCYNTGSLGEASIKGEIIGFNNAMPGAQNCYWTGDSDVQGGGTGTTENCEKVENASALLTKLSSAGFIADTNSINNGYPVFAWQNENAGGSSEVTKAAVSFEGIADGDVLKVDGKKVNGASVELAAGEHSYSLKRIGYKEYTGTFTVAENLESVTINITGLVELTGITVSGNKEKYTAGDELTGLTVTATYADGTSEAVEGYTTDWDSSEAADNKTVTVTYEGKTATFTTVIEVKQGLLAGLAGKASVELVSGSYGFEEDTANGYLKSNNGAKNSSKATMKITATNAGVLSFKYKISSEKNYDWLDVQVNGTSVAGQKVEGWSGTVDWTEFSKVIGKNDVVTITYSKDSSGNKGDDAAYLKDFAFAPAYTVTFSKTPEAAAVTLKDAAGNTVEGNNGSYTVADGTYTYEAKAFGYETKTGTITVNGQDVTENISLTRLASQKVTFNVALPEGITGDYALVVKSGDTLMTAAADGSYSLPAGEYTYSISHDRCEAKTGTFTVAAEDVTLNISLERKWTVQDYFEGIDVTASNGTYGFVLDKEDPSVLASNNQGKGSSSATLTLKAGKSGRITFSYKVGSEASYDKFSVANGSVNVLNNVSGNVDWTEYSVNVTKDDVLTFTYSKDVSGNSNGDTVYLKNFSFEPTYTVNFTSAPENATITLKDASGKVISESDGNYVVVNGTYTYEAKAFGYETKTGTITVDGQNVTENISLTRLASQKVTFDVTLPEGITGDYSLVVKSGDVAISAEADGSYSLPAGEYTYSISHDRCEAKNGSFTVAAEDVALSISLERKWMIQDYFEGIDVAASNSTYGFVLDKEDPSLLASNNQGKGGSSATLTLKAGKPGRLTFSYKVGSEASYDKFTVKNGSKTIINGESGNVDWTEYSVIVAKDDVLTFTYTKDSSGDKNGDTVYLKNFSLEDTHSVVFTGLEDNAEISLKNESGNDVTGNNGNFTVINGTYTYTVTKFGYEKITGEVTVDGEDQTVTLNPMAEIEKVSISFDITCNDNKSAENAAIELKHDTAGTITAENGVYAVPKNESFTYTVTLADYVTQTGTITADANKTVSIELVYAGSAWDGTSKSEPVAVEGIYQISNAAELSWFADYVKNTDNTASAVLTSNINLNGKTWTSIGKYSSNSYSNEYAGTFDGQGYIVSGLNGTGGLFDCITADGTVKNVNVNGNVSGSTSVGGIANQNYGLVDSCFVAGTVTGSGRYIGGIVGRCQQNGAIKNSVNTANIKNTNTSLNTDLSTGGICGYTYGLVENCCNMGNVSSDASRTTNYNVAGLVGYANGSTYSGSFAEIKNCYSTGTVSGPEAGTYSLIGTIASTASVENCYVINIAGGIKTPGVEEKTAEQMKAENFVIALNNSAFNYNEGGYPVLKWQGGTEATDRDAEDVAAAKAALAIDTSDIYEAGTITLPAEGEEGTAISWSSDNADIIAADGTVTLPAEDISEVTLTAEISKNKAKDTKTFVIKVYSQASATEKQLARLAAKVTARRSFIAFDIGFENVGYENAADVVKAYLESQGEDLDGVTIACTSAGEKVMPANDETVNLDSEGNITYFTGTGSNSDKYALYRDVKIAVSKNNISEEATVQLNIGWDSDYVQNYLQTKAKAIQWTDIFNEEGHTAVSEGEDTEDFITEYISGYVEEDVLRLPAYIGNVKVEWQTVYDDSLGNLAVVSDIQYDSDTQEYYYNCVLKRPAYEDSQVALAAVLTFNLLQDGEATYTADGEEYPYVYGTKIFVFDLELDEEASVENPEEVQKGLDEKYEGLIRDFVKKDQTVDTAAVADDIQMPTPKTLVKEGVIADRDIICEFRSSDESVLDFYGYHGMVYRPLPGEEDKEVKYTVAIKDMYTKNVIAVKDYTMTVKALTQEELDAASALMKKVATNEVYWTGLKGTTSNELDAVIEDLKPFSEITENEDGSLNFIRGAGNITFDGIELADLPGYDSMNAQPWREIRSSNETVITSEQLLVTQPEYDKKVSLDSVMSYYRYAKYWEKALESEDESLKTRYAVFEQFYKQPVSVKVTVKGTVGEVNPEGTVSEITATVGITGGYEGFTDASGYVFTGDADISWSCWDAVKAMFDAKGYTYTGSGTYVSAITDAKGVTLEELEHGENSGWMFKVNGEFPNSTLAQTYLKDGDVVQLIYTGDYTSEPGVNMGGSTDTDSKIEAGAGGKVSYDEATGVVTITPDEGYEVEDVIVNGTSMGAVTKLEGIKKTDVVTVTFKAMEFNPESADMDKIIAGVKATTIKLTTKKTSKGIKSTWTKSKGYKVDKYQVYRSTSGKKGTFKRVYTTKKSTTKSYTNKKLKKGKKYYYKVRGVRKIDGKNYYTKWSNVSKRTFK